MCLPFFFFYLFCSVRRAADSASTDTSIINGQLKLSLQSLVLEIVFPEVIDLVLYFCMALGTTKFIIHVHTLPQMHITFISVAQS